MSAKKKKMETVLIERRQRRQVMRSIISYHYAGAKKQQRKDLQCRKLTSLPILLYLVEARRRKRSGSYQAPERLWGVEMGLGKPIPNNQHAAGPSLAKWEGPLFQADKKGVSWRTLFLLFLCRKHLIFKYYILPVYVWAIKLTNKLWSKSNVL